MIRILSIFLILAAGVVCSDAAQAQQSWRERFFNHNNAAAAIEPGWPTPIVESDPRLTQYCRFSFSNEYATAGAHTVSYGNARGGGIIGWNRAEFDVLPPPYIQHHSGEADGFGDTSVLVKLRLASGNAEQGKYIATAILSHTFATGSASNGARTDSWSPTLAGGKGITKRIDVESSLGGTLPTGKIAAQGRSIAWNSLVQEHVSGSVWVELENNAAFFRDGAHDGKMQNFITPGAFYIYRRKEWTRTHPFFVFDGGMQVATSAFHTFDHNLILEMRVLF